MSDETVRALRRLGVAEEVIERALERGDLESAIFDSVVLPRVAERTVSAREV